MKLKNSIKSQKSKKTTSNGIIVKDSAKQPQWKKVKLSGNLLSDDGGLGLEGLLGLEVLENPSQTVRITKSKTIKLKKTNAEQKRDANDDDDYSGSDDERSKCSKSQRKKKKKLLKKAKEKQAAKTNDSKSNEPGRFVRPLLDGVADVDRNSDRKSNKSSTKKGDKHSANVEINENAVSIDDLIVRFLVPFHFSYSYRSLGRF